MEYKGYEIYAQYCTNTIYRLDDNGDATTALEETDDYLDYYIIGQAGEWDQSDYPETLDEAKKLIDDICQAIKTIDPTSSIDYTDTRKEI